MKSHQSQICYKVLRTVSELSKSVPTEGPLEQRKVVLETKGETQGSDYDGRQPPEGPVKYHLEVTARPDALLVPMTSL